MHDKKFWHGIIETKGAIPDGESLDEMTDELLDYLRSPDYELRDTFGYQILTHWILKGEYPPEKLRDFMTRWLSDLQTGLGESGTDTVITRSFAALMLGILVYRDMQESYLTEDEIAKLVDATLVYFAAENDWRGYDDDMGWLHALAHTADAFKFLSRDTKSTADHHQRILHAIADKLTQKTKIILKHGEDERLALAVMDVLKRDTLSAEQVKAWLDALVAVKELGTEGADFEPDVHGAVQNMKHFLRALYFRIVYYEDDLAGAHNLEADLLEALKQF